MLLKSKTTIFSICLYFTIFSTFSGALESEEELQVLLKQMTLEEKIGQMIQTNRNTIIEHPEHIASYHLGSILSGGGESPERNTAREWKNWTNTVQAWSQKTRLKIPILYGVDAVHGHNNVHGATFFPHNIALGAANDPVLNRKIGAATAVEMAATGIYWNFAPAVSVPQDIRWGRTFEGYSSKIERVIPLANSYLQGLQSGTADENFKLSNPKTVLGTLKHFIGDGHTAWGTSPKGEEYMDQGDAQISEDALRAVHLQPYIEGIKAGAQAIMVSYSSWQGTKMHANRYLLHDVLRTEMGFQGLLISDWAAIADLPYSKEENIKKAINAGIDMAMVPYRYEEFFHLLKELVANGQIAIERIDEAVLRILKVKFNLGLFGEEHLQKVETTVIGQQVHRDLAREAVRKSSVLLKNENQTLPLQNTEQTILVSGLGADDMGAQLGGWSIQWQGELGPITIGQTILEGLREEYPKAEFSYFKDLSDAQNEDKKADLGIVVVAEKPYAEWFGDRVSLQLDEEHQQQISLMRKKAKKLLLILAVGRPLVMSHEMEQADAAMVVWTLGSEGRGVAEILGGGYPLQGTLPYAWPRDTNPMPEILYPYGFGLSHF